MSSPQKDSKHLKRLSLIHVTPVNCADLIIESQHFKTGNGLYGVGVYFANTLEAAALKVKHHKEKDIKWTYLIADVYYSKTKSFSKTEAAAQHSINTQALISQGYNCIFGYQQPTGREIVCLDPSNIHNIKYIYGQHPSKFFFIDRPRIVLFYITHVSKASKVHDSQTIDKTDGPFGKGFYLYYTLSDARKIDHKENYTYFACDAYLDKFHELTGDETLSSKNIKSGGFKSFHGHKNHIHYYIFNDRSMFKNFHFCGGKPWNVKKH